MYDLRNDAVVFNSLEEVKSMVERCHYVENIFRTERYWNGLGPFRIHTVE